MPWYNYRRSLLIAVNMQLKLLRFRTQNFNAAQKERIRNIGMYATGAVFIFLGLSYAAVPMYRIFCNTTGYAGTTKVGHDLAKIETMTSRKDRKIRVQFTASVHSLNWSFKPEQEEIEVYPGETALAFFRAKNLTNRPIIGISTYNIVPYTAGYYFNKVQCFCFEEQLLQPNEEVDMPVFFFIDPDYADDPSLAFVDDIVLSYTFYESKSGLKLPMPLTPADHRPLLGPVSVQSAQNAVA